jgi:hypothetical protein
MGFFPPHARRKRYGLSQQFRQGCVAVEPGIARKPFTRVKNRPVTSKKAAAKSSPPPGLASENVEMTAD